MSTPRNRYIKNNINNLMTNNQPKIISNTKSISKLKDYSDKNNCLRLIQINPFKSSDPPTSPIKTQNNLAFLANVKYGPKKLANINENSIEIPLKSMGKATLDCRALFGAKMNIIKSKKKQYNNEDNTISANNLENVKSMSFRNEYIIKFSNSAEYFNKLQKYAEFINNDKQSNFNELFLKMKNLFKNQNHLFFDKNYEENTKNEVKHSIIQYKKDKNSLPKINSAINSRDEIDLSIIEKSNNYSSYKYLDKSKINNENDILDKKDFIIQWYELTILINKILTIILNDLEETKIENKKLNQKILDYEALLSNNTKEIEKMKKFLNQYEVGSKLHLKIKNQKELEKIKSSFNQKENKYLMSIYKLENEIKALTNLLDHNKIYYNQCKDLEKEIEIGKKKNEELKLMFNQEIREKNATNVRERLNEEDLLQQINNLNETIEEMQKERNIIRKNEIENQLIIKKLNMNIDEKNENIVMLNEELEWYIRELDTEKFNLKIMKNDLNHLENIILKDANKGNNNELNNFKNEKNDKEKEINNIQKEIKTKDIKKEENDIQNNENNSNNVNVNEENEKNKENEENKDNIENEGTKENEGNESINPNYKNNNNYSLDNDKEKDKTDIPTLNLSLI